MSGGPLRQPPPHLACLLSQDSPEVWFTRPADTHIPPAPPVEVWALGQGQAQMQANQSCLLTRPACAPAAWGAARHCLSIRRMFARAQLPCQALHWMVRFREKTGNEYVTLGEVLHLKQSGASLDVILACLRGGRKVGVLEHDERRK